MIFMFGWLWRDKARKFFYTKQKRLDWRIEIMIMDYGNSTERTASLFVTAFPASRAWETHISNYASLPKKKPIAMAMMPSTVLLKMLSNPSAHWPW